MLEKMNLMEEEALKHKELIANLEKATHFAAAPPLAPLPAADTAAASPAPAAAPLEIPEEQHIPALQIESPLVERNMEDLINDLGGAFSPDDDDADEVAGGGGYRCSLLLLQNKARSTPLQNLNKKATTTASLVKQHSCSSVEKQVSPGATASAQAASPLQSGHVNSTASDEGNTPPADADVSALKTADEGGGLFTLFRGLARSGGGGKDGETSGDTMMDDNDDSKSNITSPNSPGEGGDGKGVIKARNGNDVMEIDGGGGGAFMKRESLGLDGPEPFQSQGSMN